MSKKTVTYVSLGTAIAFLAVYFLWSPRSIRDAIQSNVGSEYEARDLLSAVDKSGKMLSEHKWLWWLGWHGAELDNTCFIAFKKTESPEKGPEEARDVKDTGKIEDVEYTYTGNVAAQFDLDFKLTQNPTAQLKETNEVKIVIDDLVEEEVDSIAFDPVSTCAFQDLELYKAGKHHFVISGSVRTKSITAGTVRATNAEIDPNRLKDNINQVLKAKEVRVADKVGRYLTTVAMHEMPDLSWGAAPTLPGTMCTVNIGVYPHYDLNTRDVDGWTYRISCLQAQDCKDPRQPTDADAEDQWARFGTWVRLVCLGKGVTAGVKLDWANEKTGTRGNVAMVAAVWTSKAE